MQSVARAPPKKVQHSRISRISFSASALSSALYSASAFVPEAPVAGPMPAVAGVPTSMAAEEAAPRLKLYDFPLAFNPPKAKLALVEKGLPFETQVINILGSEGVSPKFLGINPAGSVPVLQDRSKILTQSKEIIEFVDKLGAEPLGGAGADRALVADWLEAVDAWDGNLFFSGNAGSTAAKLMGGLGSYKKKVAQARRAENPRMAETYDKKLAAMQTASDEGNDDAKVASNRQQLVKLLDRAEKQLASTNYLAGSAYSMADVIMTPVLYRIGTVGQDAKYINPRPRVAAYWRGLQSRPSFSVVFGPAKNPVVAAQLVLPILAQVTWATTTGRY